jgi:hypothetical protein
MALSEADIALSRDQSLVDSIIENIGSSNMRAFRYKTILRMNPYMANNPQAVASMANMPISTQQLMGQAGAIYGMQTANRLATDLTGYSDSVQRSIFAGLTGEQQQTLTQMGYSLPERKIEDGGWFDTLLDVGLFVPRKVMGGLGKTVGPVVSPALDALITIGDFTFGKPYRTISQLSGVDQWLSLIAGVGVTAASLLLMPATAGASSGLMAAYWGGNIARVALAAQAGMATATGISFVSSSIQNGGTGVWTNAWSNAWDGEKLFRTSAIEEAQSKLVDPTVIALAQDFAAVSEYPGELIDIAKLIAGQRGATDQNVQFQKIEEIATKYAGKDSPIYQTVYKSLTDLINEPIFQEAVEILENGKISVGRDIANFLGLDPSSGVGRWVSGGIDATSLLVFDPFNQIAGGMRAIAQVRRGLQIADGVTGATRFAEVLSHKSMARKMAVVLEAANKGDATVLRKGAQEWRPIISELHNYKLTKGTDLKVDDVIEFIIGQQQFSAVLSGIGVIKGSNYHQIKHLSRTESFFRKGINPVRDVLAGVSDVRAEVKNFPRIMRAMQRKDPEAARLFAERLLDVDNEVVESLVRQWGLDEQTARMVATTMANPELATLITGTDDIFEHARLLLNAEEKDIATAKAFFGKATENLTDSYRLGRLLGRTPAGMALRPIASFIDGVSTQIPRGAVHITGFSAADDIRNYVEMFRTIGVPSYVRNQWINTITMAPNGAARLMASNAMLDSFATAFGMRFTERGSQLLDEYLDRVRQLYGYGETARRNVEVVRGLTDSFPVGVRPVRDMADMFAIPDLIEIRRATRMGIIMRASLGISESTIITALQGRFWKPAVLLRMGFFLRNASEEMLSLMVRYGSGRWGQETASRMIGERAVYRETRERAAQYSHSSLTPLQQYKLERNTHLPGPLRAAGRVMDRMPDSWPMWGSVERLKNWMFRSFDSILGEGMTIRRLPGGQLDFVAPEGGMSGLEGILVNGLLGDNNAIRQGLKAVAKPEVNTRAARAAYNLQTLWKRLAFGDTYSLRRMLLGGIDDRLLQDAMSVIANNDTHFRAVMSHVGTSKLATWQTYGGDDVTKQIVINENGSASYELVHVGSTRRLSQQGQQAVGEQPWDAATLEHQQRWIEDPFGKAALQDLSRYYNDDIKEVIDRDELLDILQVFGNGVFDQRVHIDKDLWHLYLHASGNQRVFRREMFDSYLAQMIKTDEVIEALALKNPRLAQWARNRNEIAKNLQVRFPGNTAPTWRELSEVITEDSRLLVELDRKFVTRPGYFVEDIPEEGLADQVVPQYEHIVDDNILSSEIDVTGVPILESFGFRVGYSKIRSQIDLLNRVDGLRSALKPEAQDYVNRMLATWMARPNYLDLASVNARGTFRKPNMVLYVGKANVMDSSGKVSYWVSPEGDLHLTAFPRDWMGDSTGRGISMSMHRQQAERYLGPQSIGVTGARPETVDNAALFVIDGDQLLHSIGLTTNDVHTGITYFPGQTSPMYEDGLELLRGQGLIREQEFNVFELQRPAAPYSQSGGASNREISFNIHNPRQDASTTAFFNQDNKTVSLVVPKGAWALDTAVEATDLALANELAQHSADFSVWSPFIEDADSLETAIRNSFREVAADSDTERFLNLNPDYLGAPKTQTVYGVDVRDSLIGLTDQNADVLTEAVIREAIKLSSKTTQPLKGNIDLLTEVRGTVGAALRERAPLVFDNAQVAEVFTKSFNKVFNDAQIMEGITYNGGRALTIQAEVPPTTFGKSKLAISDNTNRPANILWAFEPKEAVLWDFWDKAVTSRAGQTIEDRAVRAFMDDMRSGRRTQLVYKQSGGQLYRNQLGVAVPLQDGEIIQSTTPLYTTEKMAKTDQVFPGQNMRYFKMETPTYVGQTEMRWPTIDAILFDEARKAAGSRAFQLNNPMMLPPTKGRQAERIALNRRELHYAGTEHVKLTPQGDLPDWQIVQVYEMRPKKLFDEIVRTGFGAIGKMIDTVSREPMAFHSLLQSIERNRSIRGWVIASSKEEERLTGVVLRLSQATSPEKTVPRFFDNWGQLGRAAGELNGAMAVGRWDDLQALSYIRGLDDAEFDIFLSGLKDRATRKTLPIPAGIKEQEVDGLIQFARITRDKLQASLLTDSTDGFIGHIDRLFGEGSAFIGRPKNPINELDADARAFLKEMTNDDWAAISKSAKQRVAHNEENMKQAAQQAIRDIMPFVDSHELRSQFAETARGFLPFWYAEENFLKRWARMFAEGGPAATLARVRKLQLQYMGLQSAGIVRTDTQGKDFFVWPGSSLFIEALDKVLPGQRIPVETFLQTPTSNLVPGFNENFGTPAVGPLVAVPLAAAAALNPEVMPLKETIVGQANVFRSITDNVFPTHFKRMAEAIGFFTGSNDPESGNVRAASAMMTAIANLDAIGGIPDNMTPEELDDVLRTVREHTKIILTAQAIAGIIGPGTTSLLETPRGSTLSWLTDGQIENPADLFSSQYYELISNLGIEEGTLAYLEAYKNSPFKDMVTPEGVLAYTVSKTTSASGAPLPSTEKAWAFYEENQDFFKQYPEAAPWAMPQNENNDTRSSYAYNQELIANLRTRRTPEEFLKTIKYKEGAQVYFAQQEMYETEIRRLRQRGQDVAAQRVRNIWDAEAQAFKLTHPIFADMLVSGEARNRRAKIITQMRYLLDDPAFPKTDHFDALKELQDAYDAYVVARGQLSVNRTMYNQTRLSALKIQFSAAVEEFVLENPAVRPYWQTVLKPESGLD